MREERQTTHRRMIHTDSLVSSLVHNCKTIQLFPTRVLHDIDGASMLDDIGDVIQRYHYHIPYALLGPHFHSSSSPGYHFCHLRRWQSLGLSGCQHEARTTKTRDAPNIMHMTPYKLTFIIIIVVIVVVVINYCYKFSME